MTSRKFPICIKPYTVFLIFVFCFVAAPVFAANGPSHKVPPSCGGTIFKGVKPNRPLKVDISIKDVMSEGAVIQITHSNSIAIRTSQDSETSLWLVLKKPWIRHDDKIALVLTMGSDPSNRPYLITEQGLNVFVELHPLKGVTGRTLFVFTAKNESGKPVPISLENRQTFISEILEKLSHDIPKMMDQDIRDQLNDSVP